MALTDVELPEGPWVPSDSFANRLVLIRKERGLTQEQAAEACDLDDGSWSNWENGTRPRGMDKVVTKIVKGLKVDRDWLMWGSEVCNNCGERRHAGMTCSCGNEQVSEPLHLDDYRPFSLS